MSDDGTVYDWLAMQQQVMPEWVGGAGKNAGYGAPDIGSQASQLNYVQDLMGTGVNPLMMWLAGQMDGGSLASEYEDDEVIPGVTDGSNYLQNVINSSPDSVEGMIAEHILSGGSPVEAVRLAEQAKLIQVPMVKDPKTGLDVPDTSQRDYYSKWATGAFDKLMSDKPEQRTPGKEILHPFVQEMLNAGFTDPRETYSADSLNPDLARMDEKVAGQKTEADAAVKQRDLMSQYVSRQLSPQGGGAQPQGIEEGRHNAQPAYMGHQPKSQPQPNQPLLDTHGQASFPILGGGIGPFQGPGNFDLSQSPVQQQMQAMQGRNVNTGSAVDAANMFEARVAGGYPGADTNRAAMAKRAEGVGRKAQQANMKFAEGSNTASLERIKAQAVSNVLGKQGRTPAMDQYQAAMQALMARGIGR